MRYKSIGKGKYQQANQHLLKARYGETFQDSANAEDYQFPRKCRCGRRSTGVVI